MRYIFIDSNAFYNHWHLRSADFELLANFIKNSNSVLMISEVVYREVQNLYQREQEKVLADLKSNFQKAQRFLTTRVEHSFDALVEPYDFKTVLQEKFQYVEFIPFDSVPQTMVVDRAIRSVLPFRDKEKGYRDTVIWLSLLSHMKSKNASDEVIFISQNTSDFYEGSEKKFSNDLAADIEAHELHCTLKPFVSLHTFLSTEVATNELEFSNESLSDELDNIAHVIEEDTTWYLEHLETQEFKKLLDGSGLHFRYARTLINHGFEIEEGMEDGNVLSYKRLSATNLYINYEFNLRRCTIDLIIPLNDFLLYQSGIQIFYSEHYLAEDEAHLLYFCRPKMTVSFVYDLDSNFISGLELHTLAFMH